ncbi:MAG: hypothetical protein ACFFFB_05395 [Candidatus Heimdallarchaeota archaeon]
MWRLNIYHNKFMIKVFGPLFGLISVIVYFSGIYLASILFTGFDFNCMISWLGGEYSPGAIFFNLGVFSSGFLAIPLYMHINRTLGVDHTKFNLKKAAITSALISCVFFSLIGLFPSLIFNTLYYYLHGIIFLICMITAITYLFLYSILFLNNNHFHRFLSYLGFITILVIILFLVTWIPVIEWIMTITIGIWVVSISIYLLLKTTRLIS